MAIFPGMNNIHNNSLPLCGSESSSAVCFFSPAMGKLGGGWGRGRQNSCSMQSSRKDLSHLTPNIELLWVLSCNGFSLLTIHDKCQREIWGDASPLVRQPHFSPGARWTWKKDFLHKETVEEFQQKEIFCSFSRQEDQRACTKQQEQSGTRSAFSRAVGTRTDTAQCSLFHSSLQTSTFKQRLSPPLFPLSNYTIYSFSAVISSHLYSPERSQDNHHGE